MKIESAKTAGFCPGVKRAVETVYEQIRLHQDQEIYTYGPIIHNEEVIKDLAGQGVKIIHNEEELRGIREGIVIIRSHGVARNIYEQMEEQGLDSVDATCPFVKKIHKIVDEESRKGSYIVIIGNGVHPEVEGIRGWAGDRVSVIRTKEDARAFELEDPGQKVCIVSQTTFNYKKFKDIVEIFSKKSYDINVMNTICNATEERQTEAGTIARQSDAMLVIGGKHSSNTQKLFEICKRVCPDTYFIQTLDDLDLKKLQSFRSVGITAGASTPNNIIKEVQSYVRSEQ